MNGYRQIAIRRQRLAREILSDFEIYTQPDSYHVWLILPEIWQADAFTLAAKNRGILVSSASYFCADPRTPAPNAIRLSLMASHSDASLVMALNKLVELLHKEARFDYMQC